MPIKKKKKKGLSCLFYGRFLSTIMITAPMTAMKTNKPMIAGRKYMSAMDCVLPVGFGDAVACVSITLNAAVADDGK